MRDFILPDIGEGIVECELLKWLVKEGDTIVEDQAVAEVMTDKATVEIPAMHNGVVAKLYYQEGEIAKVHSPLFAMQNEESLIESPEQNRALDTVANKDDEQHIEAFVLPDIGEGIVECEIVQWHVGEGDEVVEDQVVVEVMTDKAVVEIPAKYQGQIVHLHYAKGDIAKVHTPLFDQMIGLNKENTHSEREIDNKEVSTNTKSSVNLEQSSYNDSQKGQQHRVENNKQGENFVPPVAMNRALASPAVRRLARENGVVLDKVQASGKKGRILKNDVLLAMQGDLTDDPLTSVKPFETTPQQGMTNHKENTIVDDGSLDKVETVSGIRAAMAKQMMASVSTIPHFTVSDELCMDRLIDLRHQLKPDFDKKGIKLSFMPFFIKALSLAMLDFPIINSRLNSQASELTYLHAHNVGLAVDGKLGLMVPNIKNVQSLSLLDIAKEQQRLIDAARQGKLAKADLQGGSISISNIGALGGITATPVINKPEVAIVALGKTQKLPRFDEQGNVQAKNILMVNWSGDHRVIDGATMVKFNNLWLDYLSQPEKMLVHLR